MNDVEKLTRDAVKESSADEGPVLRVVNGSKIYGGIHAIDGINFELCSGEVHALVGERGRSRRLQGKWLFHWGLTSGEIFVGGKRPISTGRATRAAGNMVYQRQSGAVTTAPKHRPATKAATAALQYQGQLLQSLNFHIDPATP
jgi:ABC-type glutathione transport system ATPase component